MSFFSLNFIEFCSVLRKASFLLGFSADTDKKSSGACSVSVESAIDDNHQKLRNISFHDVETNCQLYKSFHKLLLDSNYKNQKIMQSHKTFFFQILINRLCCFLAISHCLYYSSFATNYIAAGKYTRKRCHSSFINNYASFGIMP